MKSAVQLHWDYFLLLEKDLIAISETLELSEDYFGAYGPRIVQLILAAGSELDVALKSLARAICPDSVAATGKRPTMNDFKKMLTEHACAQFSTARVKFLRSEVVLTPWESIGEGDDGKISWWDTYNSVKHRRSECYGRANLRTALELVSALFVVDAYLAEVESEMLLGFTQIVDWGRHEHMPGLLGDGEL